MTCDMTWHVTWHDMTCDMTWHDVWHDLRWDMTWHDMTDDMTWYVTLHDRTCDMTWRVTWNDMWHDMTCHTTRHTTWYDIWYMIYLLTNWVATRWQQYSTHLHTNSTQNNTMKQYREQYITIRIHKHNNKNTQFTKLNRSTQNTQPYIQWQKMEPK
jgi:hypothetical protein